MQDLSTQLQDAKQAIEPQFKQLKTMIGALNGAIRLAGEEKVDALPMQKALTKLQTAAEPFDTPEIKQAVSEFSAVTQTALDNLAFDFAKDLRDIFAERGETVNGRPPLLHLGLLSLKLDTAARKGQWFYGKEALTKPIPLSLTAIVKAYDQQVKRIVNRQIDAESFLQEIYKAWNDLIDEKGRRPQGGRINILKIWSKLTMNRQGGRFWNAPGRKTFKDYERELFVRDLVLLQESGVQMVDGNPIRLGVASKSQAEQATKSVWLPSSAADGQYYGDITFD